MIVGGPSRGDGDMALSKRSWFGKEKRFGFALETLFMVVSWSPSVDSAGPPTDKGLVYSSSRVGAGAEVEE